MVAVQPAAAQTVVDATEFGASPYGDADVAEAVQAAIAHAKTLDGPVTVTFPKGVYDFYPDRAAKRELYVSNTVGAEQAYKMKNIALLIEDADDITIDGGGSLFRMHGQQSIYAILRSTNTTVKNFEVDWVTPRTVDMTVVAVDGNTRDIKVADGYTYSINGTSITWRSEVSPYTGQPYWTYAGARIPSNPGGTDARGYYQQQLDLDSGHAFRATWALNYDPLFRGLTNIQEIEPGLLRLTYDSTGNPGDLGRVFMFRSQPRDTPGGLLFESENSRVENLKIGYLHGFGMIAQMNDGAHFKGLEFRAPAESWRQTAGFADLIQISGDKGNVVIEDPRSPLRPPPRSASGSGAGARSDRPDQPPLPPRIA